MAVRGLAMRLFRSIFREQKTRLQVDWLTHTDERIMQHLADAEPERPDAIAAATERSTEYVSDRCRQLNLRGLLEAIESGPDREVTYALSELGEEYVAGKLDADTLEDLSAN